MNKFKKVLVANRGEIAVRIIKALKEMDIKTVAVCSTADKNSLHTKIADQCICIGPPDSINSYLNTYKIISSANLTEADTIHPGIGFLAENGSFSKLCRECNLNFIGPNEEIINKMGNKNMAKQIAMECGIPIIEGSKSIVNSLEKCKVILKDIGFPALLKATYGGGGKGIRKINSPEEIDGSYELCIKESKAAFNNCELIIEKCICNAKHVEVQILGDSYGNIIHLGDRECTIQRSNQKFIEEARCSNISDETRKSLYTDAIKLARYISYIGPGTVEFLVQPDGTYYFLEMNTRLQVEHTITELITGIDLVKEQVRVFSGEPLNINQEEINFNGYAMQCRILAENVDGSFIPSFGKISEWNMPGGFGVRIDSGYKCNDYVSPYYDSMLAKICCIAPNKNLATKKMRTCLDETIISGIQTNINFLRFLLKEENFLNGDYTENFTRDIILKYQNSN